MESPTSDGTPSPPPAEIDTFIVLLGDEKLADDLYHLLCGPNSGWLTSNDIADENIRFVQRVSQLSFTVQEVCYDCDITDTAVRCILKYYSSNFVKVGIDTYQLKHGDKVMELATEMERTLRARETEEEEVDRQETHSRLFKKYSFTRANSEHEANVILEFVEEEMGRMHEASKQRESSEPSTLGEAHAETGEFQSLDSVHSSTGSEDGDVDFRWTIFVIPMFGEFR